MRKSLLALGAVLALSFSANAQWSEGSIAATGSLGYSSNGTTLDDGTNSTDLSSGSNLEIGVNGAYFIMDNVSVGLGLGFGNATTTIESTDTEESTNVFTLSVEGRYYMPYTESFSMYGSVGLGYGSGTQTTTVAGTESELSVSELNAGLGVGLAYFVSDNIFLDANYGFLGYTSASTTQDIAGTEVVTTVSDFGLNLDLTSITFGVGFLF